MSTPRKKKKRFSPKNDSSRQSTIQEFFQTQSPTPQEKNRPNLSFHPPEHSTSLSDDLNSQDSESGLQSSQLSDIDSGLQFESKRLNFSKNFTNGVNNITPPKNYSESLSLPLSSSSDSCKRRLSFDFSSDLEHPDESSSSNSIECPFCGKSISYKWEELISELYHIVLQYFPPIVKNNNNKKPQTIQMKLHFLIENKYNPKLYEQFKERLSSFREFCDKHSQQSMIEIAKSKGWPSKDEICLDDIQLRILNFRRILDELIISQSSPLLFIKDMILDEYHEVGGTLFRSRKQLLLRLPKLKVGYYGPRGQSLITQQLQKMYLKIQGFPKEVFEPLKSVEYLQMVLVPAAAILLVHQDLSKHDPLIDYPKAYQYILQTSEYGEYIFPVHSKDGVELE